MKKILLVVLTIMSFSSWAIVKPYVSIFYQQDLSKGIVTDASLILFEDGNFDFASNTGAWRFCSSSEVGRYSGKLDSNQFEKIRNGLLSLEGKCFEKEGCSKKFKEEKGAGLYTIELPGAAIGRYYLSTDLFYKTFGFLDEEKLFKKLKAESGLKLVFEKGKLVLSSLGANQIKVQTLSPLKAQNEKGEITFFDFKKKEILVTSKGLGLELKKSLPLKSRYVLSLQVEDSKHGTQQYHLCTFDK